MTRAKTSTHRYPWEHEGETLVLETPEQTTIEHRIAPFSVRCVAAALDYFLVGLWMLLLMVIVVMIVLAGGWAYELLGYAAAAALVMVFIGSTFYFTWAELRWDGRTWGKRRLGIRTLMESGHGVTFGAAVVRNLARVVDNLPLFWILPAFARGGRRIGDLLAGTVVVVDRERRRRRVRPATATAAGEEVLAFTFTSAMAARLAPEDLDLLEYVGEQLDAAPAERRRRLAATVSDRYVARLGLEHEQVRVSAEPERFLAELEAFLRGRIEQEF